MLCDVCGTKEAVLIVWPLSRDCVSGKTGRTMVVDCAGLLVVCAPSMVAPTQHACAPSDTPNMCSAPLTDAGAKWALANFTGWDPVSAKILTDLSTTPPIPAHVRHMELSSCAS